MAANFRQPGDVLTLIAPTGGVLSGQGFMVGSIFAIAMTTQIEGAEVEGALTGVWELPKAAGAVAAGAEVFFDDTLNVAKGASAVGLFPIGVCIKAAAADAPTVRVRLNGISVVAVAA